LSTFFINSNGQECIQPFQETIDLTMSEIANTDSKAIALKVVQAGEHFLNSCINPDLPLSTQSEQLEELRQLAQVVPPSFNCAARYTPTTQLVDLNNDGTDELVLHTQAIRCDIYSLFDLLGGGGLSIVYALNKQTENWSGTLIWPCTKDDCPWTRAWTQSPQPLISPLKIEGQNQAFILVSGDYVGGDHTGRYLIVWHWKNKPEIALEIRLDDWCSYPEWDKWEITQEGHILIPAAEATYRCQAREAEMYVWQDDEFVNVQP
jgi:hypothetical protein